MTDGCFMWVKQCHTTRMTWNGKPTTYKMVIAGGWFMHYTTILENMWHIIRIRVKDWSIWALLVHGAHPHSWLTGPYPDMVAAKSVKRNGIFNMEVSTNGGSTKWLVYEGKSHENGGFRGTPIYGNPHMERTNLLPGVAEVAATVRHSGAKKGQMGPGSEPGHTLLWKNHGKSQYG